MKAFGPVPSRRLGRSLGINNIPAKVCTYSCVYCQVGLTTQMQVKRCAFYRIAYVSIPTRPPAVKWVQPPGEEVINQAYQILNEFLSQAGADWSIIHKMIAQGQLIQMNYEGKNYYMRRLSARHR